VRQFHLEVVAGRAERSPEYSLGSYVRTAVVRERGDLYNQSARIVKVRALLLCSPITSPRFLRRPLTLQPLVDAIIFPPYLFYVHVRITPALPFPFHPASTSLPYSPSLPPSALPSWWTTSQGGSTATRHRARGDPRCTYSAATACTSTARMRTS
jgi:hypothetical protein